MISQLRELIKEEIREAVRLELRGAPSLGAGDVESTYSTILGGVRSCLATSVTAVKGLGQAVFGSLTGREKAALVLVGGYVAYKYCPRTIPKIRLFDRLDQVKLNIDGPTCNRNVIHESVREGSLEMKLTAPKCQTVVGYYDEDNGVFKVHGCAVRVGDFILLPDHVFSQESAAHVKLSNGKYHDLRSDPFIVIETDVVAVRCEPAVLSQLGLAKVLLQHEMSEYGIGVSVVGALGLGTTGRLRPGDFGRVIYDGTTRGGYSGAAYMQGSRLVGIHQHGGQVNGGFSISYLWACLNYEINIVEETSKEWLEGCLRSGKKVYVDAAWGAMDSKRINVSGRYAIVTRETYEKVFRDEQPHGSFNSYKYDDYDSSRPGPSGVKSQGFESIPFEEARAGLGFRNPSGLNTSATQTGQGEDHRLSLMRELASLSNGKLNKMLELERLMRLPRLTPGLPEMAMNLQASSNTPTAI